MLSMLIGSACLGAVLLLIKTIHRNNTSSLRQIPNAHFTVPFSHLWLLIVRWRLAENRTRTDLHRQLGPIVRISPREVSVNTVEDGIRTIYGGKFEKESSFYSAFVDEVPFLFTILGNEEHKRRKRMLSHVYSKSYILSSETLESNLSKVLNGLKVEMAGWASTGASVDVLAMNKRCAVDIVTGWLYGEKNRTNTLKVPGLEQDLSMMLDATLKAFFWLREVNWLVKILGMLKVSIMPKPASDAAERWKHWVTQVNAAARSAHKDKYSPRANVYDYLYESLKTAHPDMSDTEADTLIAAECDDQVVASHQGLGIVLAYMMYELSRRPESQRALRKELLSLAEINLNDKSLSQRIEDLPMLDAVVTETLRVRPPGPGPFPRVVPDSGCRLAGHFVPSGTIVSSSAWSLHRNPLVFPSPEQWRPERWLEADGKALAEMKKWFWAFGSGPRMCIGSHMAVRIMKEVLLTIYSDYETVIDDGFNGDLEQKDYLMAGPVAARLNLKFRQLE